MKTRIKETSNNGRTVFIPQYKGWIFWKPFLTSLMDEDIQEDQICIRYDTFDYVIAFSSIESAKKFIDYEISKYIFAFSSFKSVEKIIDSEIEFQKNSKTIIHKYP